MHISYTQINEVRLILNTNVKTLYKATSDILVCTVGCKNEYKFVLQTLFIE